MSTKYSRLCGRLHGLTWIGITLQKGEILVNILYSSLALTFCMHILTQFDFRVSFSWSKLLIVLIINLTNNNNNKSIKIILVTSINKYMPTKTNGSPFGGSHLRSNSFRDLRSHNTDLIHSTSTSCGIETSSQNLLPLKRTRLH